VPVLEFLESLSVPSSREGFGFGVSVPGGVMPDRTLIKSKRSPREPAPHESVFTPISEPLPIIVEKALNCLRLSGANRPKLLIGYCWTLCQVQVGGCDHAAPEASFEKEASN
jgi:hypothetical protein